MEINLRGNMVLQDMSIEEALSLQAGLANAIQQAMKHGHCCGPTIAGVSNSIPNQRAHAIPLAVSFNIYNDKKV